MTANGIENLSLAVHSEFVCGVFAQSGMDVTLFVDKVDARAGAGPQTGGSQHVFRPFFEGQDNRLVLMFVVQICENPKVMAMVLRVVVLIVLAPHLGDDKGECDGS